MVIPPQIRAILGVLIGTISGYITMTSLRAISPFQPPAEVGIAQANAFNTWVSGLSTEAYLSFLGFFCLSALIAGAITEFIVRNDRYPIAPFLTGFILIILAITDFLAYNHPEWMTYSSCIGFAVFAWIGGILVRKIRHRTPRKQT